MSSDLRVVRYRAVLHDVRLRAALWYVHLPLLQSTQVFMDGALVIAICLEWTPAYLSIVTGLGSPSLLHCARSPSFPGISISPLLLTSNTPYELLFRISQSHLFTVLVIILGFFSPSDALRKRYLIFLSFFICLSAHILPITQKKAYLMTIVGTVYSLFCLTSLE